ncbi:hypothetical protein UT300007_35930 [Clostridium sp. CTA-7]
MINKTYFSNVQSRNIVRDTTKKNLSEELSSNYIDVSLDNIILNSNLEDQNIIK